LVKVKFSQVFNQCQPYSSLGLVISVILAHEPTHGPQEPRIAASIPFTKAIHQVGKLSRHSSCSYMSKFLKLSAKGNRAALLQEILWRIRHGWRSFML
jgi:hypothetical protein